MEQEREEMLYGCGCLVVLGLLIPAAFALWLGWGLFGIYYIFKPWEEACFPHARDMVMWSNEFFEVLDPGYVLLGFCMIAWWFAPLLPIWLLAKFEDPVLSMMKKLLRRIFK